MHHTTTLQFLALLLFLPLLFIPIPPVSTITIRTDNTNMEGYAITSCASAVPLMAFPLNPAALLSHAINDRRIQEQGTFLGGLLCCPVAGQNRVCAEIVHIEEDVTYLDNFNGLCNVDGPRNCEHRREPTTLITGLGIRNRLNNVDYTIASLGFKGTIHGIEVELNGTVQYPEVVGNATMFPEDEVSIKPNLAPRSPVKVTAALYGMTKIGTAPTLAASKKAYNIYNDSKASATLVPVSVAEVVRAKGMVLMSKIRPSS
ncbi:uncharacterized protein PAC_06832 [Phialocephala subalpina]|uniref:Uncharacterized protein n=1 Tax=Phialocephala subalpina TaxID=576137 RepID=A0A1L7WW21_9HELO|nr:uncharacterized protein PAC_06832 [Phialocephala subalpina]